MLRKLTINELVTRPGFGANKITKEFKNKLKNSLIVGYNVTSDRVVFRALSPSPIIAGVEIPTQIGLNRLPLPSHKVFFDKLEANAYNVHGEIDSDALKEDLTPLYDDQIDNMFGIGTDPELISVSKGISGKVFVAFKTKRTKTKYNALGQSTTETIVNIRNATWQLEDVKQDFNAKFIVPVSTFSSLGDLTKKVAQLLNVDQNRISISYTDGNNRTQALISFANDELVYRGNIDISIVPKGDTIRVIDLTTGLDLVDPVDPPPKDPTVNSFNYDRATNTVSAIVEDLPANTPVQIKIDDGELVDVTVDEGIISHVPATEPDEENGFLVTIKIATFEFEFIVSAD